MKPPKSSAWSCRITDVALKTLSKLPKDVQARTLRYVRDKLSTNLDPRLLGVPLKGIRSGLWRFRMGDYRLICEVFPATKQVDLLDIGHRRDVYK